MIIGTNKLPLKLRKLMEVKACFDSSLKCIMHSVVLSSLPYVHITHALSTLGNLLLHAMQHKKI